MQSRLGNRVMGYRSFADSLFCGFTVLWIHCSADSLFRSLAPLVKRPEQFCTWLFSRPRIGSVEWIPLTPLLLDPSLGIA